MRPIIRALAVMTVVAALTAPASAAPRESGPKEKVPPIKRLLRMVRALGDGIIIPLP